MDHIRLGEMEDSQRANLFSQKIFPTVDEGLNRLLKCIDSDFSKMERANQHIYVIIKTIYLEEIEEKYKDIESLYTDKSYDYKREYLDKWVTDFIFYTELLTNRYKSIDLENLAQS